MGRVQAYIRSSGVYRVWMRHTVKSSNFVILLSENIFFLETFLRLPHNFFRY
jgi:hypothetical protein